MSNAYVRPIVAAIVVLLPTTLIMSAVMGNPLWTGLAAWAVVALLGGVAIALLRSSQRR